MTNKEFINGQEMHVLYSAPEVKVVSMSVKSVILADSRLGYPTETEEENDC